LKAAKKTAANAPVATSFVNAAAPFVALAEAAEAEAELEPEAAAEVEAAPEAELAAEPEAMDDVAVADPDAEELPPATTAPLVAFLFPHCSFCMQVYWPIESLG